MQDITSTSGLTRRQLLERGALVGGAVLATQSLGVVTAFAQTSPPPPSEEPPTGTGSLPSNFQLVVEFAGVHYGVKYDSGSWGKIGRGTLCGFTTPFDPKAELPDALVSALSAPGVVRIGTDADGHMAYIFRLPSDVVFVEGRPKDGTCKVDADKCGGHVEAMNDGTYAFAACD